METPESPEEDIRSGEETPDYGERPQSPEEGFPTGETSPAGGLDPGSHEHPDDVRQPPDEERDQTSTESPADPSETQDG